MRLFPGWLSRAAVLPAILRADNPRGPWGGGNGGNSGGGDGPRNPWAVPPGDRRPAKPTALDEFLKRARTGGGGGGGGLPGFPGGANPRALWGIGIAVLVVAWIVLTSFHSISPQQRGVVTYFGRYSHTVDPGIRPTLPAPFAHVEKVDVQQIRTEDFPAGGGENLTLTGDQNIIDLAYSVRWDIADPQDYVFQIANPQETVQAAAESAMRAVMATTTFEQAVGTGRTGIEQQVQELTQRILSDYNSGVRIQGVAIKQATAPARIVEDFNAVLAAQQEAVANTNQARSYAQQIVARAQGEAAAFNKVYEQYRLAPEVTRRRMYYETMEDVLAKTDKTIVETPGVLPYLPLDRARRTPAPEAAPAPTPAQPAAGGGQ